MGTAFSVEYMLSVIGEIASAVPVTALITVVAFTAGLTIGLCAALVRMYKVPVLNQIVIAYTSFMRGTPLLVQLYIAYYGLPIMLKAVNQRFGWSMDVAGIPAIVFVFTAYALNTGGYLTETVRSAIQSVDVGQTDAARSIGMTGWQTLYRIILPQALLVALPNLGNTVIALIKDTSLAFSVTIMEIIGRSRVVGGRSMRYFEVYVSAALIYWGICIICEIAVGMLERGSKRKRGLEA